MKLQFFYFLFLLGIISKSQGLSINLDKIYYNSQNELILDYSLVNKSDKDYILFTDVSARDK